MFLDLIRFLRVNQWYKNLVVFLAIVASGNLFDASMLGLAIAGFFILCMVSSSYYVVNDVADRKRDMFHPEKCGRPVAAGKIKPWLAIIIAAVLLFFSLMFSAALSVLFFWAAGFLFAFTILYTFVLKRIIFIDMISIGVNFFVRAVAGALIIVVWVSPYLVVLPFFFSLYLSAGKRYSDLMFSGQNHYGKGLLKALVWVFFILLIGSFMAYCFAVHPSFLWTLPVVVYALLRYNRLIFSGSKTARKTELIFADLRLLISMIACILVVLAVLY